MISNRTIVAVATGRGGAISIIRLSGALALECVGHIFHSKSSKAIRDLEVGQLYLGDLNYQQQWIDEVMLVVFKAPHSYTGEDCVEIHCHASPYIQNEILRVLVELGAELAAPGEFTQRAFLNGKLDLVQAESVADLIASQSAAEHRMAFHQMKGKLSDRLNDLRVQLLDFASLIELELDFSEEDVEFADREKLAQLANQIAAYIGNLAATFQTGNAIKQGVPVVLVGATNAGKSSLLNQLLQDERAIVSPIHGTTRDFIEDIYVIGGLSFRFIDTAGIRDTDNEIENLGIERSFDKINKAHIVLWLIDASLEFDLALDTDLIEKIMTATKDKALLIVFNKIDKLQDSNLIVNNLVQQLQQHIPKFQYLAISAKEGIACQDLKDHLLQLANLSDLSSELVVTNSRHYQALRKAHLALERVKIALQDQLSGDLLAPDIREAIDHLADIVGEVSSQDVLNNIFGKFCIGK